MKRFIALLSILFMVTGCSSMEQRIEKNIYEDLKEKYNIEQAEVTSIEEQHAPAPFIVYALDRIFNGKNYDVEIEVSDSTSTTMTGLVNNRKMSLKRSDYVKQKHDRLKELDEDYQDKINQLAEMGLEIEKVTEGSAHQIYQEGTRLIDFTIESEEALFDVVEFYDLLSSLSNDILENIDTLAQVELTVPTKVYYTLYDSYELSDEEIESLFQKDATETFKIEYKDEEYPVDRLDAMRTAIELNEQMDVEKVQAFQEIETVLHDSSISVYHRDLDQTAIHLLRFINSDHLDDEKILELIELLQEMNFDESYIEFVNRSTGEEQNKIGDIQTIADVEEYF